MCVTSSGIAFETNWSATNTMALFWEFSLITAGTTPQLFRGTSN